MLAQRLEMLACQAGAVHSVELTWSANTQEPELRLRADLSEQKRVEGAVRESGQHRDLIENANDHLHARSFGRLTGWNRGRASPASAEDVQGMNIASLVAPITWSELDA